MFAEAKNIVDLDPMVRQIVREELRALLDREKAEAAAEKPETKTPAKKKD